MRSPKILLFLFFICSFAKAQSLRDDLMLHLPFMGDGLDYSSYSLDAAIMGPELAADRFDRSDNAYYFDGVDDLIILSEDDLTKPSLPITFSMWVKAADLSSGNNMMFTNDDDPNQYSGISVQIDHLGSGTIAFGYGTGGGSGPSNRRTAFGSISLVENEWQHIVGVIRGPTDMDLYINGQKDVLTYSGDGGELFYTNYPGKIGGFDGNSNGPTRYFEGSLDDVKLWNASLEETEVAKIYGELFLDVPMDGNAIDYSSNLLDGFAFETALTTNRFGEPDKAYAFDGDTSNIYITGNGLLKTALPISVSFWVNPKDNSRVYNPLFTTDDNPDYYNGIWGQLNPNGTGEMTVSYGTGGGAGSQNRRSAIGTTPIPNNEWTHVVTIIRGPEDMDIYINGVKDLVTYSGTGAGSITYSGSWGSLGGFKTTANGIKRYFEGSMDDVKMWNRVISEAEIAEIYTEVQVISSIPTRGENKLEAGLFPNPVTTHLQVTLPTELHNADYLIYNINGAMVGRGQLSSQQNISVTHLPQGIYHIELVTNETRVPLRFVKI